MIDHVVIDQACDSYDTARESFLRTPKADAGFYRKYEARDEAHDRLVHLLILHGAVYHHKGHALWVEHGELHRAKIHIGLPKKRKKAAT